MSSPQLWVPITTAIMSLTSCILFTQEVPLRGCHAKPGTPVATLWSRKARRSAFFMMSGKYTVRYLNPIFSECFSDDSRINVEVIAMRGRGGVFCKATDFEDAKSIYDSARNREILRD